MKKRVDRWPEDFRRTAVERMGNCGNVAALAKELGVYRSLLYKWRDHFAKVDEAPSIGEVTPAMLPRKLKHLKRVLAGKARRILSVSAGLRAGARRSGGAVHDSGDRRRASPALWLSTDHGRAASAWDAGQSQARGPA